MYELEGFEKIDHIFQNYSCEHQCAHVRGPSSRRVTHEHIRDEPATAIARPVGQSGLSTGNPHKLSPVVAREQEREGER